VDSLRAWSLLLLVGCLPRTAAPLQANKGMEPAATTLAALQQARAPRRVALVVGVDRYTDPTFPMLQHAEADARDVAANLSSAVVGGFGEVRLLVGGDTDRDSILEALRAIRDTLRRDDVLVVYFSGHGTRRRFPDGSWHRYLVPSDGVVADLPRTALDLAELQSFFSSLEPARKALIVDACFDGEGRSVIEPSDGEAPDWPLVPGMATLGAGEAHLFATSAGRPAREDDTLGHGVYTWYLLDAMSWSFAEADVDEDGVLTAWEAHDWARGRTIDRTQGVQVPEATFRVVGEADVVLAGAPEPRKRSDRALVYLYPTERQSLSGAQLIVDGREKGELPRTVPLTPGRHHFVIRHSGGEVAVDGYLHLQGGRAYTVDEIARLAQGPGSALGVRAAYVSAPALRQSVGAGALGTELYWADRRSGGTGRGFTADLAVGAGFSSGRPELSVARPVSWASSGLGWQGDRGHVRLRAGLGASFVFVPRQFPEGRPENPVLAEHAAELGWWMLAAGPSLSGGWVLGSGWTVVGTVRPHLGALDVDFDGRAQAAPWLVTSVGLEVDR
jgi:uncharacterized caspase-like protein